MAGRQRSPPSGHAPVPGSGTKYGAATVFTCTVEMMTEDVCATEIFAAHTGPGDEQRDVHVIGAYTSSVTFHRWSRCGRWRLCVPAALSRITPRRRSPGGAE